MWSCAATSMCDAPSATSRGTSISRADRLTYGARMRAMRRPTTAGARALSPAAIPATPTRCATPHGSSAPWWPKAGRTRSYRARRPSCGLSSTPDPGPDLASRSTTPSRPPGSVRCSAEMNPWELTSATPACLRSGVKSECYSRHASMDRCAPSIPPAATTRATPYDSSRAGDDMGSRLAPVRGYERAVRRPGDD